MKYPLIINEIQYYTFTELQRLVQSGISSQSKDGEELLACLLDGYIHKYLEMWAEAGNVDATSVLRRLPDISQELLSQSNSTIMAKLIDAFGGKYQGESINIEDYVSIKVTQIKYGDKTKSVAEELFINIGKDCDVTLSVLLTKKKTIFETLHLYLKSKNDIISNEKEIDLSCDIKQEVRLKIKDFKGNNGDDICLIANIANNPKVVWKVTLCNFKLVDLGLSVKWATCNIGAESPEDYGDYFAWGETSSKSDYSYKYYRGTEDKLTKYCNKYNKTVLDLSDDAARVNWGGSWRMPTDKEWDELVNQCFWRWTTQNGVKGYKVTSNTNGNSIFLPAAGYRTGTNVSDAGSSGCYWSSSLDSFFPGIAYFLHFYPCSVVCDGSHRYYGRAVRAVCP